MNEAVFDAAIWVFPDLRHTIERIAQVRREAYSRPYEEFLEPISAFDLSGNSPRLIGLTLANVHAFSRHMAYGARARMLSLEMPILEAIVAERLTASMVLLRSHAETAGLACLALMTLRDCDSDRLRDVVQRSLFGSALAKGWKSFGDLADFVPSTEADPPLAGQLMHALDRFVVAGGDPSNRYKAAYGLLCEYAHPNSRGMLGFARSAEEAMSWRIRYTPSEEIRTTDPEMVLALLLEMMRLGYAASEFLRLGVVCVAGDGFSITPPSSVQMKRILTKLMLLNDVESH